MPYNDLRKGRVSVPGQIYFITSVIQRRTPIFSKLKPARILASSLGKAHEDGFVDSLAWVIMPDHFHWLIQLTGECPLSKVIRQVKGHSAIQLNRLLNLTGSLWQKGYYDHALRAHEDIRKVARYIIANPLRAGLVQNIGDYPHWDAVWL